MTWVILFVAGLFEIGWAVGPEYPAAFVRATQGARSSSAT
jgi:multidrug transporter EmrE-like cation transporter